MTYRDIPGHTVPLRTPFERASDVKVTVTTCVTATRPPRDRHTIDTKPQRDRRVTARACLLSRYAYYGCQRDLPGAEACRVWLRRRERNRELRGQGPSRGV